MERYIHFFLFFSLGHRVHCIEFELAHFVSAQQYVYWYGTTLHVLRSSGISRKLGTLIVRYIARKKNEFLLLFSIGLV